MSKYDFSGWVTKNDIMCSDGVVIRHGAFGANDGATVPMVWQHDYSNPSNTLGHITLEHRDEGVYGYGSFNGTSKAQDAKLLVQHGDVRSLSIGARNIVKDGQNVVGGDIYEVSLVLKGANPGARIEHTLTHSAYGEDSDSGIIYTDTLLHSDEEGDDTPMELTETVETLTETQAEVVEKMLEDGPDALDENEQYVLETLNEDQIAAVAILMDAEDDDEIDEDDLDEELDEIDEDDDQIVTDAETLNEVIDEVAEERAEEIVQSILYGGEDTLKHNAYYGRPVSDPTETVNTILHAAIEGNAQSLAATLQANGVELGEDIKHGLANIDILFPNTQLDRGIQTYNPGALNVDKIMGKFTKLPTSRVKNIVADISEESARARGYIKGNEKFDTIEELFYRETTPGTVIRRTKIDRDDIIDIRDNGIDVVAFLQKVQQAKLQEEIVRAAFFGDGRPAFIDGSRNPDKISEQHVRPIATDEDLYTIKAQTDNWGTLTDTVIKTMPAYQGSGKPALFINPFDLAVLKTLKDQNGRYLYGASMDSNTVPSNAAIAAHFMCDEVIEYREMPQGKIIIGNLADYAFGMSKNGQVATFDQFDIDFNQHKYLIECRLSGAIRAPKSFVVVEVKDTTGSIAADDHLKFDPTGLKRKPMHTVNTDETEVPGPKYASKHGEEPEAKPAPKKATAKD